MHARMALQRFADLVSPPLVHAPATADIEARRAMARFAKKAVGRKQQRTKKAQPKKKASDKYVGAVKLFKLFVKDALRSYAAEDGAFLLTEGQKSPARYFTAETVREKLTEENSELLKRPGMGVNLLACNVEAGLRSPIPKRKQS